METIQGQPNICHHEMECMVTLDFTVPKLAILRLRSTALKADGIVNLLL